MTWAHGEVRSSIVCMGLGFSERVGVKENPGFAFGFVALVV